MMVAWVYHSELVSSVANWGLGAGVRVSILIGIMLMPDSGTLWVTITNLALGAGVGLCVLITAVAIVCEILARRKVRHS